MTIFAKGTLVESTAHVDWGPGEIVHVSGNKVYIVFRDLEQDMARQFVSDFPAPRICAMQTDSVLDNLPPLKEKDGQWVLPKRRWTLESLKRKFVHEFPTGFADPEYFGQERDYKLKAHVTSQEELGLEQLRTRLTVGDIRHIATKALSVLSSVNLVSPYESAAFRDAMQNDDAVRRLLTSLLNVLDCEPLTATVFEEYVNSVTSLPADRGRVATWPVATVFPYLAQPERHMFLKPGVTKEAANSLGFDLQYDPTPNWVTYNALLHMGSVYLDLLKPMGARDFLDVQSFIYVSWGVMTTRERRPTRRPAGRRDRHRYGDLNVLRELRK